MTFDIEQMRKNRDKWWYPVPTDQAWLDRLRADYPETAATMSDDDLRDYYDGHQKFATTWDHIGDAYGEYEPLAEAFIAMESEIERLTAVNDEIEAKLDMAVAYIRSCIGGAMHYSVDGFSKKHETESSRSARAFLAAIGGDA